jgi:hypothetical protein
MLDYNGFGYTPDYGYKIYRNQTLLASEDYVQYAACFSRAFGIVGQQGLDTELKGIYTLRCRKVFRSGSGNYCCLDRPSILKILRYMRRIFNMKIHFTESEDNFIFVFTIVGKPIKHKFMLTFSRVFFEFPYNEFARDVLRLRAKGVVDGVDYTHKSFLELFHLIESTYYDGWGIGHSLFPHPNLYISLHTMKTRFEEGVRRVHDVYPGDPDLIPRIKRFKSRTGVDWEDDFEDRIQRYSDNFKILKAIKYEKSVRRRARRAVQQVD